MHDSGNLSDYFLLCECVHGFRVCETHLEIRWIVVLLSNVYNPVLVPLEVQKDLCLYIRGKYVSQEAVRSTAWRGLAESDDQTRRVA